MYNPIRPGRAERNPWRATLESDQGIVYLYHYWCKKYLDKAAVLPSVRSHLTLVKQRVEPPNASAWGFRQGEYFSFQYEPIIHTGNGFYWLNVYSDPLNEILIHLGLPPKHHFHLTVAKEREIA